MSIYRSNQNDQLSGKVRILNVWIIIFLSTHISLAPAVDSGFCKNKIDTNQTSNSIAGFNVVIRDFDLNTETEDGFTITNKEYDHLLKMWHWMSPSERTGLLQGISGDCWNHTLTLPLLYSLNAGKSWHMFIADMIKYDARGVAITISRLNCPVSLETAHRNLLDLFYSGSKLIEDGKLIISDTIKTAAEKRAGIKARIRLERWEKLINDNQQLPERDKLWLVNGFFNHTIQARPDDTRTETYDYWQSPLETLIRGIGDCEDFALAKYFSLRLLGIPAADLLITMVYYPLYSEMHGVLAYYSEEKKDPYVLDNISFYYLGQNGSHIVPLSIRMKTDQFKPLWAINEESFIEFQSGVKIKSFEKDPCRKVPRFWIAMANAIRIMPEKS